MEVDVGCLGVSCCQQQGAPPSASLQCDGCPAGTGGLGGCEGTRMLIRSCTWQWPLARRLNGSPLVRKGSLPGWPRPCRDTGALLTLLLLCACVPRAPPPSVPPLEEELAAALTALANSVQLAGTVEWQDSSVAVLRAAA